MRTPYSPLLLEHFQHPRNVGSLPADAANTGTAVVGTLEQGHLLQWQLRVAGNVIDSVRFKAYGSPAMIACASLLSDWVQGQSLEHAARIDANQLVEALQLPPLKIHCALLAQDALRAAMDHYRRQHTALA